MSSNSFRPKASHHTVSFSDHNTSRYSEWADLCHRVYFYAEYISSFFVSTPNPCCSVKNSSFQCRNIPGKVMSSPNNITKVCLNSTETTTAWRPRVHTAGYLFPACVISDTKRVLILLRLTLHY